MAFEAELVLQYEPPVPFTCANATGIEKGALLQLTDPLTASITSAAADQCAGICASEKIASNGETVVAVHRRGRFKVYGSGAITVGDPLTTDAVANYVKSARALTAFQLSGVRIWGYALETSATGDTLLMELQPTPLNGV